MARRISALTMKDCLARWLPVIRIDNEAAVIVATANESIFGLSGSVITHDTHGGSASPPRSRVVVFVNDNVRSARCAYSLLGLRCFPIC